MNRIPPAAAIRAYEQASRPTPAAPQADDGQLIKDQYLSLSEKAKHLARLQMAALVRLDTKVKS